MEAAPDLVWAVRPVSRDRGRGLVALGVAALAVLGSWALAGPIMGLLALALLGGGIGPFFAVSRYRLSDEGVEVRSPFLRIKRPWSDFRRAYAGARGVSLSPFRKHHILEPYRSVMLHYGPHREEILRRVDAHVGAPGSAA